MTTGAAETYDVAVVGAGLGGIYAVHRMREAGLSVIGIESASDVGGVWYHNRYPGARVDLDSIDYCYHFSSEIWEKWQWTERYAAQPELLQYLNLVADTYDVKRSFLFDTKMTSATWSGTSARYEIETSVGRRFSARFLVMTTGQLSVARKPDFPGLDRFRGEWVQTSHWPHRDVEFSSRRIAIIGTGSTAVQAIPILAEQAERLFVFQRFPRYTVPARNHPSDPEQHRAIGERLAEEKEFLLNTAGGLRMPMAARPTTDFTPEEREEMLERQWLGGGQSIGFVFSDQPVDRRANDLVSDFVRNKIRQTVRDPELARKLCPTFPIGTRRIALDTGYYETFNQDNVELVDCAADPIVEITETGIRTEGAHYDVDLVIFAIGFHGFTGAIKESNVRNEAGRTPLDGWQRGPRTLYGLTTTGFPNLFMPTGAGSPSNLANLFLQNEYAIEWTADCIRHVLDSGHTAIEPTDQAQDAWTAHAAECAAPLLRLQEDDYMVHVNPDDGSRVFIPYIGGLHRYVEATRRSAAGGYQEFVLS